MKKKVAATSVAAPETVGWYVLITQDDTGEEVKRLGPYVTERIADKTAGGVGVNMDHERFSVSVVPAVAPKKEKKK